MSGRRRVDVVAAAVVLLLGLPLVVLGLLGAQHSWAEEGRLLGWRLVLVAVVLVGMWRAGRVLRR